MRRIPPAASGGALGAVVPFAAVVLTAVARAVWFFAALAEPAGAPTPLAAGR